MLLTLLALTVILSFGAALIGGDLRPGSPLAQSAAIAGTCLLLTPLLFFVLKRSGRTSSPPVWFVTHVLGSMLGTLLIFVHIAGGDWVSAPGLIVLVLLFLVVQGCLARVFVSRSISHLFARSPAGFSVTKPLRIDRPRLKAVVEAKVELLQRLDREADEALFSPTLAHWLHSPRLSFRYLRLVEEEYDLVGARQSAGLMLQWWRRMHLLAALLFMLGLLAHLVVVLFFAGYVAAEGEVYWWHFSSGGRGT